MLYEGYSGVIWGLYRDHIRVTLGLHWGLWGLYGRYIRVILGPSCKKIASAIPARTLCNHKTHVEFRPLRAISFIIRQLVRQNPLVSTRI